MMMMINSRVCENIAISLKNCAIKLCWGETSSKLCIVVKTELSLLCGLATAKQASDEATILSDYTRWNVTFFFAAFFSKNFRLFLCIKMMLFLIKILSHDGWDLWDSHILPGFRFFFLFKGRAGLPRRSRRAPPSSSSSCFTKSVSGDLLVD